MRVLFTLFLFIALNGKVSAEISSLRLSQPQRQLILDLRMYHSQPNSMDIPPNQKAYTENPQLLKDFRTDEKIYEEIRFFVANPDHLLFNGQQP